MINILGEKNHVAKARKWHLDPVAAAPFFSLGDKGHVGDRCCKAEIYSDYQNQRDNEPP